MGEEQRWFDDLPVIGRPPAERAAVLRAIDPPPDAEVQAQPKGFFSSVPDPWDHTSHAFGFLPPGFPALGLVEVKPASQTIADEKYSFLRTKATFQRCMEAADDKYGWKKQPL
ncbi:hypothetical protein WMF28_15745 [Sorangium sp. So ce590]|uniref:hypothetical protein n=1 Tax=Sorangium sp. So ce590 TaxID=3133317 RepID=UPI003F642E67